MPYDFNDYRDFSVAKVVFAVVGVVLAIFLASWLVNNQSEPEPTATYHLEFDCSNTALMHKYGLPTRADVVEYHVFGRWCTNDGEVHVYQELPGGADPWDELYKIQDNPKFVK